MDAHPFPIRRIARSAGRLAVVLTALVVGMPQVSQAQDARLPLAVRGPHPVGYTALTLADETRPLTVGVWYPGQTADAGNPVEYRLGLGMTTRGLALENIPPAAEAAPYPLVLFSHGAASHYLAHTAILEHLASHGLVVASVAHPGDTFDVALFQRQTWEAAFVQRLPQRVIDVQRALDALLDHPPPLLDGIIDGQQVMLMGHSLGGTTMTVLAGAQYNFGFLRGWCTVNADGPLDPGRDAMTGPVDDPFSAQVGVCFLDDAAVAFAAGFSIEQPPKDALWPSMLDDRIDALALWSPYAAPLFGTAGLAAVDVPTLLMAGTADNVTPTERDALGYVAWLPAANTHTVLLEDAGHMFWMDACPELALSIGAESFCSDANWRTADAHAVATHLLTAFALHTLYDDADAAAQLQPDYPRLYIQPTEDNQP